MPDGEKALAETFFNPEKQGWLTKEGWGLCYKVVVYVCLHKQLSQKQIVFSVDTWLVFAMLWTWFSFCCTFRLLGFTCVSVMVVQHGQSTILSQWASKTFKAFFLCTDRLFSLGFEKVTVHKHYVFEVRRSWWRLNKPLSCKLRKMIAQLAVRIAVASGKVQWNLVAWRRFLKCVIGPYCIILVEHDMIEVWHLCW